MGVHQARKQFHSHRSTNTEATAFPRQALSTPPEATTVTGALRVCPHTCWPIKARVFTYTHLSFHESVNSCSVTRVLHPGRLRNCPT